MTRAARLTFTMSEKRKCNIAGCENDAEFCTNPFDDNDFSIQMLSSGEYCKKHFNELSGD